MCAQKLTNSQLNLPHGTKRVMKKPKTKDGDAQKKRSSHKVCRVSAEVRMCFLHHLASYQTQIQTSEAADEFEKWRRTGKNGKHVEFKPIISVWGLCPQRDPEAD